LGAVGGASGASLVEHFAGAAEHGGDDLGVTTQPPHGGDRDRHTVVGLADPVLGESGEQVVADQHGDLRYPIDGPAWRLGGVVVVVAVGGVGRGHAGDGVDERVDL
jgi:hypothetical protein